MSSQIAVSKLVALLDEIKDEFQREANQSILKHDSSQGMAALSGLDAVQRIERRIALSLGVEFPDGRENKVTVLRGRKA